MSELQQNYSEVQNSQDFPDRCLISFENWLVGAAEFEPATTHTQSVVLAQTRCNSVSFSARNSKEFQRFSEEEDYPTIL